MSPKRARALLTPLALALLGCNSFGDVERPTEGGGGTSGTSGPSTNGGGPNATGPGPTGVTGPGPAGATGTAAEATGAGATVGTGSGLPCVFGISTACDQCVQTKCCASLGPASQVEPGNTVMLAECLDGVSCSCSNGLNNCFSDYEQAVDPGAGDAFALSGCIRGSCGAECDCCLGI